jgi:RNA polymerase sigma-70 factor (ECF subfamily)
MQGVAQPAPAVQAGRELDAEAASAIKAAIAGARADEARDRFAELVGRHQRRASRIAYHYLRDEAEADEAVQDAFVRAFTHFDGFREELPFEVWFTRILVNACLDRIKARARRGRWIQSASDHDANGAGLVETAPADALSPEEQLIGRERRRRIAAALQQLPERQRMVFVLSQVGGYSSREVGAVTGLSESTVRVHLFRAVRKLRRLLGDIDGRRPACERRGGGAGDVSGCG